MKKVFLTVIMMFCASIATFAEDNNTTGISFATKYNLKIDNSKLANVLSMSKDQMEMSEDVMSEFVRDMRFASTMDNEDSCSKIVSNATKKNMRLMKFVLNNNQYRTYLTLLNTTFNNRGIKINDAEND